MLGSGPTYERWKESSCVFTVALSARPDDLAADLGPRSDWSNSYRPMRTLPTSRQPGGENVAHLASLEARNGVELNLIKDHVQAGAYQSPSAASGLDVDKPGLTARGTSTRRTRQTPALGL